MPAAPRKAGCSSRRRRPHDAVAEANEFGCQPFDLPLGAAIALAGNGAFHHQGDAHQPGPPGRGGSGSTFSGERGCRSITIVSRLQAMPISGDEHRIRHRPVGAFERLGDEQGEGIVALLVRDQQEAGQIVAEVGAKCGTEIAGGVDHECQKQRESGDRDQHAGVDGGR